MSTILMNVLAAREKLQLSFQASQRSRRDFIRISTLTGQPTCGGLYAGQAILWGGCSGPTRPPVAAALSESG
jgi:hypothetical protein